MQIHQFHSSAAPGDAITNQMLFIQQLLQKYGYDSNIYADSEQMHESLKGQIENIYEYQGSKDSILLVHHSLGFDAFEKILSLPDRKILVYHNITPEKFIDDEYMKAYIRKGFEQLKEYRDRLDYFMADSNYNRQNMISMGYGPEIDVMPVQISINRFDVVSEDRSLMEAMQGTANILFVGRIVWNKRQKDVLRSFAVYHHFYNPNSKLFLVGDTWMRGYVEELEKEAARLGIRDFVFLPGKVSEEALKAYYLSSDIFLCMSEHEGYGAPLLEAMKLDVPVIAYRASAVPETMKGAGVLVDEKNHAYIGALMDEILTDGKLRDAIVARQRQRVDELKSTETERILFRAIDRLQKKQRKPIIQMQGSFASSYSLAIVNRKLMETMDDRGVADVSIHNTDGYGDYEPNPEDLLDKPHARKLWEKSKDVTFPDIVIRNMYPPRAKDVDGGMNFYFWGWEESFIPEEYIRDFNAYLSGIGTMSEYVTRTLLDCGIKIPVKTIGIGVELGSGFSALKPYPLKTKKKFKFLHISSAFPRKGVDVLLKAFYDAFHENEDVCLVLKTFPNPHNNVKELLEELDRQYTHPPEVEWLDCDLPREELYRLYKSADCYVSVARGEGFGLPIAEAMLAKMPVIVSANSGMADFCNEDTAFLVDFRRTPAKTHISGGNGGHTSYWYEPNLSSLVFWLKAFVEGIDEKEKKRKIENAYRLISGKFSWEAVTDRFLSFVEEVKRRQYKPKVALVTTWNTKCGIAEYSRMKVEASSKMVDYRIFPDKSGELVRRDEDFVQARLWEQGSEDVWELVLALRKSDCEIVHFEYNFGFTSLKQMARIVDALSGEKLIVITFHATRRGTGLFDDGIVRKLNRSAAIIVHQADDMECLRELGIRETLLHKIPHGQLIYPECAIEEQRRMMGIQASLVIGSYGFLFPHKGIKETIMALPDILQKYPDALYLPVCSLRPDGGTREYYQDCLAVAEQLHVRNHVRFITDFLSNEESMKYLQCCDIISYAFSFTAESASGSVRLGIAANRPLLVTRQPIFSEFSAFTYQIANNNPRRIAEMILKIADPKSFATSEKYLEKSKEYIRNGSWPVIAKRQYELYRDILEKRGVTRMGIEKKAASQ